MKTNEAKSSEPINADQLRRSGMLFKQRDVLKGWRPRYFVLDKEFLHYYLEKDDTEPRKSILMTKCIIVNIPKTKVDNKEFFPFVITHEKSAQTYNLSSENEADRDEWVRVLTLAGRYAPSATSDMVTETPPQRLLEKPSKQAPDPALVAAVPRLPFQVPIEFSLRVEKAIEVVLQYSNTTDGWTPAFNKQGVQAYRKPGALVCVRGDGFFQHHLSTIFQLTVDMTRKGEYDSQFETGRRLRMYDEHNWVDYLKFKGVWPTAPRDLCNFVHWRVMDDGTLVFVAFSQSFPDLCPKEEGVIRAECIIGGYVMRCDPVRKGGVNVTYLVQTDLKGTIPAGVVNYVAEYQPLLLANMRKIIDREAGEGQSVLFQKQSVTNQELEAVFRAVGPEGSSVAGAVRPNMPALLQSQLSDVNDSSPIPISSSSASTTAAGSSSSSSSSSTSSAASQPHTGPVLTAIKASLSAPREQKYPTPIETWQLFMLFMPIVFYFALPSNYRSLGFIFGLVLGLRYVLRLHLGDPVQRFSTADTSQLAEGRMIVKFPIDLVKIFRYLEEKRKATGIEINVTHLAVKSLAIALHEFPSLNGHVILGGFYLSRNPEISVSQVLPEGESAIIKVKGGDDKSVEDIAYELKTRARKLRSKDDENYKRKKQMMNIIPPFFGNLSERFLNFLGSQLGFSFPLLNVQPFPLGNCTLMSAASPDSDDNDVDMTIIPTQFNSSTPITFTIGGIRLLPSFDNDHRIMAQHVLNVTTTIDCRAATLLEGRKFCERVQSLMRDPSLLDKHDRIKRTTEEKQLAHTAPFSAPKVQQDVPPVSVAKAVELPKASPIVASSSVVASVVETKTVSSEPKKNSVSSE